MLTCVESITAPFQFPFADGVEFEPVIVTPTLSPAVNPFAAVVITAGFAALMLLIASALRSFSLNEVGLMVPPDAVKPKFWLMLRGSVFLTIVIEPQLETDFCSIEMSDGFEEKLDPDARDSQSICDVVLQAFGSCWSAFVRSTPNSANCPAGTV